MNTLIIKLNATGDVVRTTTLLSQLGDAVTWVTMPPNNQLLSLPSLRCLAWSERHRALDRSYQLVINLEDDVPCAAFAGEAGATRLYGAHLDAHGGMTYTEDARPWFDLSLISRFGRQQADVLKLANRRTYQELIFAGLDKVFRGERYVLPQPARSPLNGDVAIAPVAGKVWPMKAWAHYAELSRELEAHGYTVNVLPQRDSLVEHLADVASHRCLVSGDSLPMHLALGTGVSCVTLFNCTSPWEIYDYGLQTKIVSPRLEEFFYKREYDPSATTAIRFDDVFDAVQNRLRTTSVAR